MDLYNQTHTPNTTMTSSALRYIDHNVKAFHSLGLALTYLIILMNAFVCYI